MLMNRLSCATPLKINDEQARKIMHIQRLSRATALRIAAVLSLLIGLWSIATAVSTLPSGAAVLNQEGGNTPPYSVYLMKILISPVQLIGAYGAWRNQRWGVIALLLAHTVDVVFAAPGLLFAPTPFVRHLVIFAIVTDVIVIVLCLSLDRKSAAG